MFRGGEVGLPHPTGGGAGKAGPSRLVGGLDDVFRGGEVGLPHLKVDGFGVLPGELHDLAYARDGHGAGDRGGRRGPVAESGSALLGTQWASSFACLPCSLGQVVDKSVAVDDIPPAYPAYV